MESNKEHEESIAPGLQPAKEKKLEQSLSFQTVSSLGSPNTSNKKRKLSSPSPTSCENPKVQKIGKKENSLKFAEVIDVEPTHEKDNKTNEVDVNVNSIDSSDISSHLNDKKTNSTKQGDISKLSTKASVVSSKVSSPVADKELQVSSPAQLKVEIENKLPIALLNRCDDEDSVELMTVSNDSLDNLEEEDDYNVDDEDENEDVDEDCDNEVTSLQPATTSTTTVNDTLKRGNAVYPPHVNRDVHFIFDTISRCTVSSIYNGLLSLGSRRDSFIEELKMLTPRMRNNERTYK